MAQDNDKIKNLYNAFVESGYDMEPEAEFMENLKDATKRRAAYDAMVSEGYDMEPYEEFESNIGFGGNAASAKPIGFVGNGTGQFLRRDAPAYDPYGTGYSGNAQTGSENKQVSQTQTQTQTQSQTQTQQQSNDVPLTETTVPNAGSVGGESGEQAQNAAADGADGGEDNGAPLGPEAFAKKMQMQMSLAQQSNAMQKRVDNIVKGNTTFGGGDREQRFNPTTGKMETVYYTNKGEEVSTPIEQWEENNNNDATANTRMNVAFDAIDDGSAAQQAWDETMQAVSDRSKKRQENIYGKMTAFGQAATMGYRGESERFLTKVDRLQEMDLDKMCDRAWNALGKEKQDELVNRCYDILKHRYKDYDVSEEELTNWARQAARSMSDQRMYELAVKNERPQSELDYLFRKVMEGNSIEKLTNALARSAAGTTGDMGLREVAMQDYLENDGSKATDIAGMVLGVALDPVTWISGGVGGMAGRGVAGVGAKVVGEEAMRAGMSTAAKLFNAGAKVAGGAANFATFEGLGNAVEQLQWGGVRDEGGNVKGYDAGAIVKSALHGLGMGAVIGVVSPTIGNISTNLVGKTASTAGKLGIKAGELVAGTVAEGTIFGAQDMIDAYRKDESVMDAWTESMAMMMGFKLQHAVKSAPRVISELSASKGTIGGFETRLRQLLNGKPDLALTNDERNELERGGYGDLSALVGEYKQYQADADKYNAAQDGDRIGA